MLLTSAFVKIIEDYWLQFIKGALTTLELSFLGTVLGLMIAFVFAVIRVQTINPNDTSFVKFMKRAGIGFVKTYVAIFRGTPMIVQAMVFFYGFRRMGIEWSYFAAGLFTVTVNTAAYITEILRGGIESVDIGQMEASRALGMSQAKAMLFVVVPQALKNSFAAIGNEFIINIKDTSVLNVIQVTELYLIGTFAAGKYYAYFEAMIIVAVIYFVLTFTASKVLSFIEKRIGAPLKELTSSN